MRTRAAACASPRWGAYAAARPAPGSRSQAAALLASARDAELTAREARAAAAEARFARLAVTAGPRERVCGAVGVGVGGQPPATAPARQPAAGPSAVSVSLADGALALLLGRITQGQAALLSKILGNAGASPGEPKFRQLRLANARVADALLASGALHTLLLPCLGWELAADEAGQPDSLAVLPAAAAHLHAPVMLRAAKQLAEASVL